MRQQPVLLVAAVGKRTKHPKLIDKPVKFICKEKVSPLM